MKKIILTFSLILFSYLGYGQHIGQYYTLLESTGTYQSLTNANNWHYGDDIDDDQLHINIPFGFDYNGDNYTSLYIGVNGAISFSSNVVNYTNDLSATNSQNDNIVAPLWDDLFIHSADGGYIAYKTIGTSPHRKFVVEWVNVGWHNPGSTVTFKMELEETSNNIYFYYGPNSSTETRSASIGMKYDRYADNTHNYMSLTPVVPATVSYTTANNNISTSAYPGEGRIYAFKHKTYVPDLQLENKIESYSSASDGTYHNGYVLTRGLLGFYTTDFSNSNIADATGVEDMKNLQQAKFAHNQISSIQFYQYNTALTSVDISDNQFTQALDLSNYTTQIVELKYGDNQLPELDVNALTSLTRLWVNDNQLESLKVQNGNNTNFTEFHASGNPLLACIEVDNPSYSVAHWTDIDNGAGFSTDCHYGETYVPDDNFEHYLETHTAAGTTVPVGNANSMGNGVYSDNYVLTSNIKNVTTLEINGQNIADLTGIEDFTHLQYLRAEDNNISNVNLSQNTALQRLRIYQNQLTSLDVSHNTNLTSLKANVNQLTAINLNNNTALTVLDLGANDITSLDLSHNTALQSVSVGNNQLNSLNVSMLPDLTTLNCTVNQLTILDVRNGHNASMQHFYATENSNLTCIYVDNPSASYLSGWSIDSTSHFMANETACANAYYTYVPDDNFEHYLETHTATGTTVPVGDANSMGNGADNDDYVLTSKIQNVTSLNVSSQNISDITGIEDFDDLQILKVQYNQLTGLDVSQNANLQELEAYHNNLSSLSLGNNSNLTTVNVYQNSLSSIDVSNLPNLSAFSCAYNQLTALNVDNNTHLNSLNCYNNQLTSLNLSNNHSLTGINCSDNNLSALDLSNQMHISDIACSNNQITTLTISEGYYDQSDLMYLYADHNQISELDVSGLETLEEIDVSNNQLIMLSVANGNNSNFGYFDARNNSNLSCIEVDDVTYSNANWSSYIDSSASFSENCHFNETYVPDDNFEHYLETHTVSGATVAVGNANSMGNGVDNDDYVSTTKIQSVVSLNISSQNISDLTGIADFSSISYLNAYNNNLSSVDLSQNTTLHTLLIPYNHLPALDVSALTALSHLSCNNNQLTSLDVTHNTQLGSLYCHSNQLTALNTQHNTQLQKLYCGFNQLTDLDVSANPNLHELSCYYNQLTSLDFDDNTQINYLWCNNNQLTELRLQNGANGLLSGTFTSGGNSYPKFKAINNPNLTCIYVGDATAATNGTGDYQDWEIDATSNYVELDSECQALSQTTYVPDDIFEHYLETHTASGSTVAVGDANSMGNGVDNDNYVYTANIENVTSLNVRNLNISDLTGIEDFTALTNLTCYNNNLSALNISANTALTTLFCYQNQLTSLDISQNTNLVTLYCSNNNLTSLDVSHNTQLQYLYIHHNNISSIDLSHNTGLKHFYVENNQLTSLDLDSNNQLERLWCYNNQLTELHLQNGANGLLSGTFAIGSNTYSRFRTTNNPNLTCIFVDDATAATNGTGNYQDWEIDTTSNYVETNAECQALNNYDLTVNVTGNGSVALSPTGGNYAPGTSVTLTATADAGWQFDHWSGDLTGTSNPATITMDSDKTITAVFTHIQHSLTINTTGNGSIALSPTGGTYNEGTTVTLTATPDAGWEFAGWSGDLTGSTNPASITMNADKTVTATFNQLTQTYVPDDNFEAYLEANGMGNGIANDNYVTTNNINTVTNLDVSSKNIADMTGIQDFAALQILACYNNQLTTLDVSQNMALSILSCHTNQLTILNFNNNLHTLNCSFNQLIDLDVSANTAMTWLKCTNNQLTDLDVRNGNNTNFTYFNTQNNPDLTCIFVDDPAWSDANWTNIDATSHFVANQTECDNVGIDEEELKSILKVYPNPVDDHLIIQTESYQNMDVSVYSLIGQELIHQKSNNGKSFVNLKSLPAATYVVKITIDGRSVYYNVIKE